MLFTEFSILPSGLRILPTVGYRTVRQLALILDRKTSEMSIMSLSEQEISECRTAGRRHPRAVRTQILFAINYNFVFRHRVTTYYQTGHAAQNQIS